MQCIGAFFMDSTKNQLCEGQAHPQKPQQAILSPADDPKQHPHIQTRTNTKQGLRSEKKRTGTKKAMFSQRRSTLENIAIKIQTVKQPKGLIIIRPFVSRIIDLTGISLT
jgi:hypothetical protein